MSDTKAANKIVAGAAFIDVWSWPITSLALTQQFGRDWRNSRHAVQRDHDADNPKANIKTRAAVIAQHRLDRCHD